MSADARPLKDALSSAPTPFDRDGVDRLRESWGPAWSALSPDEAALIGGVAGCAPYLRRLMARAPDLAREILDAPPGQYQDALCAEVRAAAEMDFDAAGAALRVAKRKAALAIALADIGGALDVMAAAAAITRFADETVDAALRVAARRRGLDGPAGVVALAMGKMGAFELNYSSDIDLVILFDAAAMGADPQAARERAVRMARDAVALLQNQTAEGYVFRTDLRLRPDPGVSALAISIESAERYYEAYGQNWERMAYIKARPAAGDLAVGEAFLKALRPYVWRRHLDFAAIDDVVAVKRQIHSAKGGGEIEFTGHDVKTGRGGIREIEFFAQTQQLILGGKNETLRVRGTLTALERLAASGAIGEAQRRDLDEAYRYLRFVEHRLQMVNDEQTHRLPVAPADIERAALFCGAPDVAAFRERVLATLHRVQREFDDLFADEAGDVAGPGPLVFTGVEDHPATLETLAGLGFARAAEVSRRIRQWHAGGLRATRSERARRLLTRLTAPLLTALARSGDPDAAFFAFDEFLTRLPAGVQIFALLANRVALFDELIEIVTVSPFLGREMSRRPNFIESLLENGLATPLPPLASYADELREALQAAADYEEKLNALRRWAGEAKFFVSVKLAVGAETADVAAAHFTAIADAAIAAILPETLGEFERVHGRIDGAICVVGLGRLGAGEMTAASDIDLIFIYEAAPDAESAGPGARPLGGVEYFTRLVRRLVTALSAATQEGALYEVDMALRPSGGAGPAAVSFSAFQRYYERDAWTWEFMALTKARVIAGEEALCVRVNDEVARILQRPRQRAEIARDVNEMRRRLMEAKPAKGVWDVKNEWGALTDIAFITQFLGLMAAHELGRPPRAPAAALAWLRKANRLNEADADCLIHAQVVFDGVFHAMRAATGSGAPPEQAGAALGARLAAICGASDFETATVNLSSLQERVASVYQQVLGKAPKDGG